ncbi:MAG TPA: hypothetical protein VGH89_16310 [Pseudonocardia sp.]|jgi:hypothetical protein
MSNPLVDYQHLGQWTNNLPAQCSHPTTPHRLVLGRMLNGWAECSCGGHRTVQCLNYADGRPCRAVHYLPALTATCSLGPIPRQRQA